MTEDKRGRGRPNIIGTDKGIGPLEAQAVRALDEAGRPASVWEVCEHLGAQGYFAYQGIPNSMNRLTQKGIPARTERKGAYEYRLLVELEALAAEVLANVHTHLGVDLDRIVGLLLHIDPERGAPELARLRRRLQATPPPPRAPRRL